MTLEHFRMFVCTGTWTRVQSDLRTAQRGSQVTGRRTLKSRREGVTITYQEDYQLDNLKPGVLTTSTDELDIDEVWKVQGMDIEDDDSVHEMDGYLVSDDLPEAFSDIDYSDITASSK